MPYFASKMLHESLIHGHLLLAQYIINNGFPIKNKSYPSALHASLEVVDDHLGLAIVNFLCQNGCDVDRQVNCVTVPKYDLNMICLISSTGERYMAYTLAHSG